MGKRTTTRHKDDNRFRFETFEEKLRKISVNVNLSIRDGRSDQHDENDTYFIEEIEKWIDFNHTESFVKLLDAIGTEVKTLPQLIFQKDRIAWALLHHIRNESNDNSLEPTLAIVVAFARDLSQEFLQYLSTFSKLLFKRVLTTRDPQIIEIGFKCYAYLLKYMRPYLKHGFIKHLKLFSPMINSNNKAYVVLFACEAFGVIGTRYANEHPEKFCKLVHAHLLASDKNNCEGVSMLLLTIFKGIKGRLKIADDGFNLRIVLDFFNFLKRSEDLDSWLTMTTFLLTKLLSYAEESNVNLIWSILQNRTRKASPKKINYLLKLYAACLEFEGGKYIVEVDTTLEVLKEVASIPSCDFEVIGTAVTNIILTKQETNPEIVYKMRSLMQTLVEHLSSSSLIKLNWILMKFSYYFQLYLPMMLKKLEIEKCEVPCKQAVHFISDAIVKQKGFSMFKNVKAFPGMSCPTYLHTSGVPFGLLDLKNMSSDLWNECEIMSYVKDTISSSKENFYERSDFFSRCFVVFSRSSHIKKCPDCSEKIIHVVEFLKEEVVEDLAKTRIHFLLLLISFSMDMVPCENWNNGSKFFERISDLGNVSNEKFSLWALKFLDDLLFRSKLNEENVPLLPNNFVELIAWNLTSGFKIVRALSLSIMRNVLGVMKSEDEKLGQMIDKFLQIESKMLDDPKLSTYSSSVMIEAGIVVSSENFSELVKKVCTWYSIGLMFINFKPIWNACIKMIRTASQQMNAEEWWEIISFHLIRLYPNNKGWECPPTQLFCDEDVEGFLHRLERENFRIFDGFQPSVASENIDVASYRTNMWKAISCMPVSKSIYAELKEIIDKTISFDFDTEGTAFENVDLNKQVEKTLTSVYELLKSCELAGSDEKLWGKSLDILMSHPYCHKVVWEFLFSKRKQKLKAYKDDIDELIGSESLDVIQKFRSRSIDPSFGEQYVNESLQKRELLMSIITCILIGKEKTVKAEKRMQILRFFAGCKESHAQKYIDLVFNERQIRKCANPAKSIEMLVLKIGNCLKTWRYTFPKLLPSLLEKVTELAMLTESLELPPFQDLPAEVFEEQKKTTLKSCRYCMVSFFECVPKIELSDSLLTKLFSVFVWPAALNIVDHCSSRISWLVKLFKAWSQQERFHKLFTCAKDEKTKESAPIMCLFALLGSSIISVEGKKYVLKVLINLVKCREEKAEIEGEEINESENVDDEDYEPVVQTEVSCPGFNIMKQTHQNSTQKNPDGLAAVLLGTDTMFDLFLDEAMFKKLLEDRIGKDILEFLAVLTENSQSDYDKILRILLECVTLYKNDEESLIRAFETCARLMSRIEDPKVFHPLIMKVASLLLWVQGRRPRTALVAVLSGKEPFYELLEGLNSWNEGASDIPDFPKRQEALDKCIIRIQNEFERTLVTLVAYNSFHILLYETDLGLRSSAKSALMSMANAMNMHNQNGNEDLRKNIKECLDDLFLPRLRGGIQHKDESKFFDFLQVLYSVTRECHPMHRSLKELDKVLTIEIVDGLQDMQVHLRTRAMNKLCKKILAEGEGITSATMKSFILPLASHNLQNEEKLGKNYNELVDSSIEVYKAVLELTNHDLYFKHLGTIVMKGQKNVRLVKQYERILIAVMDAFHFDLSAAVEEPEVVQSQMSVNKLEEAQVVSEEDEFEEETTGEEKNLQESTERELKIVKLSKPCAVKCLQKLKAVLIPRLQKYLSFEEKATHKLSKAIKTVDEAVILKIPCTIALIKLLKKIPKSESEGCIRSIIPNLTVGLRNELLSVRNTIRKTLLHVIKEIGTSHLRSVFSYMRSHLRRGYQCHVLHYSVSYLVRCLEPELKRNPEHLAIPEIIPMCEDELFGIIQEEKELAAIRQKTREATKNNAALLLKTCAKCIDSKNDLYSIITPAVKQLSFKRSSRVVKNCRQWLIAIAEGLVDNVSMNGATLIQLIREVHENQRIIVDCEGKETKPKIRKLLEEPKDSMLLPKPQKSGLFEEKKQSFSVILEFLFNSLCNVLNSKKDKMKTEIVSGDVLDSLGYFVPHLIQGIQNPSKQINIAALKGLTLLLEWEIEPFQHKDTIESMKVGGFSAMNRHCYQNTTDLEMINSILKFLTGFFIRFPGYEITVMDFDLILKCIESYFTNDQSSSCAITLLKGVLHNKYRSPHLNSLMMEVFNQSIQSFYPHINEGCRQAYLIYISNYCTTPKELTAHVQLILKQLDYKHENGRLSAVEAVISLLKSLPEAFYESVKELIFLKLFIALDKEGQVKVREKLVESIGVLFNVESKKTLFKIMLKLMFAEDHVEELDTFFLICGQLISDGNIVSAQDLSQVLMRLEEVLNPDQHIFPSDMEQDAKDYAMYQGLVALRKGLNRTVSGCPIVASGCSCAPLLSKIFKHIRERCLLYDHEWVPHVSLEIYSQVLSTLGLDDEEAKKEFMKSLEASRSPCCWVEATPDIVLMLNNVWNLMSSQGTEARGNLLKLGAAVIIQGGSLLISNEDGKFFSRLIHRMRRSVNKEVIDSPQSYTMRMLVIGCYRAILKTTERKDLDEIYETMLRVAVREITDESVSAETKHEAEKLTSAISQVIGNAPFNQLYAKITDVFYKKREQNKAKKKESLVLNPGKFRKRKAVGSKFKFATKKFKKKKK